MKLACRLAAIAAAGALTLGVAAPAYAAPDDPVSIPDAVLRACIAAGLGVPTAPTYTEAQLESLRTFRCSNPQLANLQGVEHMTAIQSVTLESSSLSDTAPLKDLGDMSALSIDSPLVTSIESVRKMSNLQALAVKNSPITDLTPLSGKQKLEFLRLEGTKVASLSGLGDLTGLYNIDITDGVLSDIADLPVNLGWVNLTNNRIQDVSPLSGRSVQDLLLDGNQITDVSPLASLSGVVMLGLNNNNITNAAPLKNLRMDQDQNRLSSLGLINNHISDVSFLTSTTHVSHAIEAPSQKVTSSVAAQAGIPAIIPIKGRPATEVIKFTLPAGVSIADGKILYPAVGTYSVKWAQKSYYHDALHLGNYVNFGGTFTQRVTAATGIVPATPKIAGTTRIGARLTASGAWYPTGVSLKYQWLRNGAAISGGTASSYVLTPSDLGKRISVRVTGSKTNLPSVSTTSSQTAAISAGILGAKTPSITGKVKKGKTLRVKMSAWTPAPVKITYQWLRNGKSIKGATKSNYKLVKNDKRKRISVRVTGSKTGYTTVSRTSAQTAKVK